MKGRSRTWRARSFKRAIFFAHLSRSRSGSTASPLRGSKTAVDSVQAVYFASGLLEDQPDDEYSFMNPVSPTAARVATYDVASAAQGTPKFTKAAEEIGELDYFRLYREPVQGEGGGSQLCQLPDLHHTGHKAQG